METLFCTYQNCRGGGAVLFLLVLLVPAITNLSESVVCEAANGAVAPTGDPPLGGGLSLCYVNPHRNVQFPARAGYFLKPLLATHWHPSCSQHLGHCQQLEQSEKNRKTPDHMLPGNNMVPVAHRDKPLRIFELYANSHSAAVGQMRMH